MPLTRYQIRNEYSLADPELYRAADKDDPEALLEGVAMAGLVGVLRQLGDLAEFAAEIFHDLHEEVMTTAARGHGLMARVQQLEAEFPSVERAFLSQTGHSLFFHNTGVDWHPNLHMDQNLITQGDLPRFVMDSYEECRGPPRLFLLDKFDVAGAGACLKRYTDPSFFKLDSSSSGMTNAEVQREKKTRKAKKKGSRWRNGETPEVLPASHAKLHQLLLEDSVESHMNDPARRVKLKRRLNGFPFDSKTGNSYMEKFLKTHTPDQNDVREISVNSSPLKLPSNITGESGIEILEISTVSRDKELLLRKRSPCSSPDVQETGRKLSINELSEEVDYGISEVPKPEPIYEADNVMSALDEEVDEKEIAVDGERKIEGSVDGYQSDDIASEVENYMDALTTMDSEIETDTECRAKIDPHFLNIENQGMDSDANEEHQDLQAHSSDCQSIGNSTATDDGNSSSRKGTFSFSYSDSLSNLAENTPSDGDVSARILSSTEICEAEIVHRSSDWRSANGDSPSAQDPERVVCDGVCIEEANIPSCRSELGEPSSSCCLTDSTPMALPVDPGKNLMEGASMGLELDEISSTLQKITPEENATYLGDNLPRRTNCSDGSSQTRDDFLPEQSSENHSVDELDDEDPQVLSHASLHPSNILELAPGKKSSENLLDDVLQAECAEYERPNILVDSHINSPHSVASHTEEQHLDSTLPEQEICSPDMKSDGIISEENYSHLLAGEIAISSTSEVDSPQATNFTKQPFQGISENVPPIELDSAEVGFSYSGEEKLDGASNAADGGELGGFSPDMDMVGKDATNLKFQSDFRDSPNPSLVPGVHLDNIVTETVHSEVMLVATAFASTHCDNKGDDGRSLLTSTTEEESISILQNLRQNGIGINNAHTPEHLRESGAEKEVDQQAVASSDVYSVLCNTDSCDDCNSELLNSVPDSSVAAISGNSLHIADATTVPLSSDQHDRDSESKSGQQINVIENAEDPVSSPTHHVTELRPSLEQKVELEGDQFDVEYWHDQDSESKSGQQINVIENAEDVVSSPTLHDVELRSPVEQKVELQDSESKSGQQSNVVESAEDAVSSPTHRVAEIKTAVEQKVELQDDQFDVESQYADKASSKPFALVEQIQCPTHLDQERHTDASSEFCVAHLPSQPPVSEFLPKLDVSELAKEPSSSILPSFGLLPEVSQINLGEMPPLPPLPPMQWRMGKVQHASLASERDLVGHNLDSFPLILPSTAGEKPQWGHLAIEGEITQPSNPIAPLSALKDENSQHGYENLAGYTVLSNPLLLQVPTMVNHRNDKDDFPTSGRTQSRNPSLEPPTIYSERSDHGFVAPEGRTAQPSVNPFSPVINVEHAVSTYPSRSFREELVHPLHRSAPETTLEDEKLQGTSVISKGKAMDPPDTSFPPPMLQDDQPQHSFSTSEGLTAWSWSTSVALPPFDGGKPNGNGQMKLPRPRNPLIDAVVAHDKSKLRKVTERVRPQMGQKVDERDSLLEQIRTKSFNLKPAVMTRASTQGPKTNLKVAAILEKANAIRQALAGSDEDDDADSWSDS